MLVLFFSHFFTVCFSIKRNLTLPCCKICVWELQRATQSVEWLWCWSDSRRLAPAQILSDPETWECLGQSVEILRCFLGLTLTKSDRNAFNYSLKHSLIKLVYASRSRFFSFIYSQDCDLNCGWTTDKQNQENEKIGHVRDNTMYSLQWI